MELRHLRSFVAVAEALHFRRAAARLGVSQPALSQQIKQLEEELGAALFERLPSGVRLTAAGEVFRGHASRSLEDAQAGQRAVRALSGLAAGSLRVGYLPSLRGLVVPAVAAVLGRHPGVQAQAEEGVARRVERQVADGKLDVGISYAPTRAPDVEAEALLESRLGLVVPAQHPLRGAGAVALARLADEPFALLSRGLRARAAIDVYCARARFSPHIVLESNAVAAVLAAVREGLAVTLLPDPVFAGAGRLPVLRLTPAPAAHLAVLLWRRGAPRSAAAEAFAAELRARAAGRG